jgi:hypothetical protein
MKSFNATPNSLSTLYVNKRPCSKEKYPKFNQPYYQPFKGKDKPIFSNLNNYNLYITKKNKMFLMQEMGHGIKDGRIKMAKHKANAMQGNPTKLLEINNLYVIVMIVEKFGSDNTRHLDIGTINHMSHDIK